MIDIILDTLIDALKILPFLFITFLLMEYFEHKLSENNKKIIEKSGKVGPLFGGILGAFPQCGFSVAATNLYSARIITTGTLISVYLSTSDEMLPIFISEGAKISIIIKVILIKVIVGIIFGFIIDLFFKKREKEHIHELCDEENCNCNNSIFKSSLKHTINILIFIIIVTFILNSAMYYFGEEKLSKIFLKNSIFSPFITSLIGLIPNCGASVIVTELYLNNMITLGSSIAGLLTGSGVALIILYRTNHNLKENIKITCLLYFIGVIVGILIDLLGIVIC